MHHDDSTSWVLSNLDNRLSRTQVLYLDNVTQLYIELIVITQIGGMLVGDPIPAKFL